MTGNGIKGLKFSGINLRGLKNYVTKNVIRGLKFSGKNLRGPKFCELTCKGSENFRTLPEKHSGRV